MGCILALTVLLAALMTPPGRSGRRTRARGGSVR